MNLLENLFFRHPSRRRRCCFGCLANRWNEHCVWLCEKENVLAWGEHRPSVCLMAGGPELPSLTTRVRLFLAGNQSPTLITHLEVNCSLICNFFVRKTENSRSVYRFSGLWPAATHFFLTSRFHRKGDGELFLCRDQREKFPAHRFGRAVIITKARRR